MTRPWRNPDPPVVRPAAVPTPVRKPVAQLVVEVLVALSAVAITVGVYLLLGLGWALIVGGALTGIYAVVIVDIPSRPVRTGPRREE
jgi:hypothetical protein